MLSRLGLGLTRMKKYEVILFDWGNVILKFSYGLTFKKWAELTPYNFKFFETRFIFDQKLVEYEKGAISSQEYFKYITKILDIDWNFKTFEIGWNSIYIGIDNRMLSIIKRLKQRYKIYILTNTNELHAKCWKEKYKDILDYFDGIFCSYELQSHKPESAIYKKVLKIIDTDPTEVLFIDDKEENVLGAKNVGIDGIVAKSPEQLENEMKKMAILPKY